MAEKRLTHTITVDLAKETWSSRPVLVQNSDNTFLITVLNDGEPADLSDVRDIVLAVIPSRKKAADSVFSTGVKVGSTSQVKIDLGRAAVATPGIVQAQLKLTGTNGGLISSTSFNFEVQMDAGLNFQPSENELTLIETVLGDGPTVLANATQTIADMESTQATLTGAVGGAISSLNEDKASAIEELDNAKTTAVNELAEVREANRFRQLDAVATVAERDSTYPNPEHGDTVRVTSTATMYRYDKDAGWVVSDRYEATAVDALSQQLAETSARKADKTYVDTKVQAANLAWRESFPTVADLQAAYPSGDTFNHVVVENGMIYTYANDEWTNTQIQANGTGVPKGSIDREKIADKAIIYEHLSFLDMTSNLINTGTAIEGYSLGATTGALLESQYISTTDFFKVDAGQTYTKGHSGRLAFYDSEYIYISSSTALTVTAPSNAFYARLTYSTTDKGTVQLNVGSQLLPYEPFGVKMKALQVDSQQLPRGGALELNSIDLEHVTFAERTSNNLFNKYTAIFNKRINTSNGGLSDVAPSDKLLVSDYIAIEGGTVYTRAYSGRIAFYDVNRKFISSTSAETTTTPSNAAFAIISGSQERIDLIQMQKGSELKAADSYKVTLSPGVETYKEEIPRHYYFPPEEITGYYDPSPDQDYSVLQSSANLMRYAEFETLWNELIEQHPTYFTKTVLGRDASDSYDIYKISAKPTKVSVNGLNKSKPKIAFIAGIHGGEKHCQFGTYHFFKDLAENWMDNPQLEYLRWNIDFEFIPTANPWGFDNSSRQNSNGVDLNRNFVTGWSAGEPGTETYGGSAPLSEPETQILVDFINNNLDALYFGDYHNHASQDPTQWIWISLNYTGPRNDLLYISGENIIRKSTNSFSKKYGFPYVEQGFGYVSHRPENSPIASVSSYARGKGLPSNTFECFPTLNVSTGLPQTLEAITEYTGNWFLTVLKAFKDNY